MYVARASNNLPKRAMHFRAPRETVLPSKLETAREIDAVLDALVRAAAGRREEGVGGVADLDDAALGRGGDLLRVAPHQRPVDDGAVGRGADQLLRDLRVVRHGLLQELNHLLALDALVPVLYG